MSECRCGASATAWDGPGRWRTVSDLNVDDLVRLLEGRFDYLRCDAGCQLDVAAGVVFHDSRAGDFYVVAGDGADPSHPAPVPLDAIDRCHVVTGIDELRGIVVGLLTIRIRRFLFTVVDPSDPAGRHFRWRRLTAAVMAAVGVALTGRIPRLDIDIGESNEDSTTFVAARQQGVWHDLLADWTNGTGEGTFERDLCEYVDRTTLIGDVTEFLVQLGQPDQLEDRQLASMNTFRCEAVRASLHARIGLPNPKVDSWAFIWLFWEASLRESGLKGTSAVPGLTVSVDRVRATIPPDSARFAAATLHNAADELGTTRVRIMEHIESIFQEFGYTEQFASLLDGVTAQIPIKKLARHIVTMLRAESGGDRATWVRFAEAFARPLVAERRVADLRRIARAMREGCTSSAEIASAGLWFYWRFIDMGLPKPLLDEIGTFPAPDENSLPPAIRGALLTLRAHALRLVGRPDEAWELLSSAPGPVLDDPANRVNLALTRARLLRERGSLAEALELLESLLADTDDPEPPLYEALAAMVARFGRYPEAVRWARAAYDRALRDRMAWPVARFAAHILWFAALGGGPFDEGLFDVVRTAEPPADLEAELVTATAILACPPAATDDPHRQYLDQLIARAGPLLDRAIAGHEIRHVMRVLYVTALYDQSYRRDRAPESWMRAMRVPSEHFGVRSPDCYLYAAAHLLAAGDRDSARTLMGRAFVDSAAMVGNDSTIATAASAGAHTASEVDAVTAAVFADDPINTADLRLVGELRRGFATRALGLRGGARWHPSLDDEVVADIAPDHGRVGVLEWVSDGRETRTVFTAIHAGGSVTSTVAAAVDVDLMRLDRDLRYRLSNWRPGRSGDPFDVAAWRECRSWLAGLIAAQLDEGDHLVVIPFVGWPQLPWHVAAHDLLTCSYQPSWRSLLDIGAHGRWPRQWREAVITVPRVGDPIEITNRMAEYVAAVQATTREGLRVLSGAAGDRAAVVDLLQNTDLTTLLTHGYTSATENEVALMLAADGRLPLAHSVAAHSDVGRRHRFGWREYAMLTTAPRLILSAACGTGSRQIVGLGEQLGFYNVLRAVGLRAFVAPQWDIVARDVLPILSDLRSRYLDRRTGLARCLREAVRQATDSGIPPWSAHALTLEGDWR